MDFFAKYLNVINSLSVSSVKNSCKKGTAKNTAAKDAKPIPRMPSITEQVEQFRLQLISKKSQEK